MDQREGEEVRIPVVLNFATSDSGLYIVQNTIWPFSDLSISKTGGMKLNFKDTQALPIYLFVIGVFLIVVSPNLLSDGMFTDGLIYSTIANNLSNGIGSFWNPHFTDTCFNEFHEHPPLAIGIQSIFYTLFGESRFVDKIYSILTFVITGYIIFKIWHMLKYKHGWVPLLFWLFTPMTGWASSNNMLENTVSVFTALSVLFYLKSQNSNRYLFVFLSGLMLAFGFLAKGFVAFFPLTLPFLFWIILREKSFRHMASDSIGVCVSAIVPLVILVVLVPEAALSLQKYFDTQVVKSIKYIVTVNSRFYIFKKLFTEMLPAICLLVFFIAWGRLRKASPGLLKGNIKLASVFVLLGLAGVFPIMISLKQSGYYILATFPFFALGAGIFIYPLVSFLFAKIDYQSKGFTLFKRIGYAFFITGLLLSVYFSAKTGRDNQKLTDTYLILSELPSGSIINIYPGISQDWSLYGYYGRYKNISLDTSNENKRDYLLIKCADYSESIREKYKRISLSTVDYCLLKKE